MPIEVIDRDGTIIEFPDGTSERDMASAMRRRDQEHEARARARPAAPPPPPSRRGEGAPILSEITGALANVNKTIPFAQDFQGLLRGGSEALQGRDFGEGYRAQLGENQAASSDFMERRPNAANFAQGTGYAVPLAATARPLAAAASAVNAGTRGAPLLAQQIGQGGSVGSVFGYAQGAGTTPGQSFDERVQAGNEAGGVGGLVGMGTPLATNAVRAGWNATRPMRSAIIDLAERIPTPNPRAPAAGALGANAFTGPPRRPPPRRPAGGLPRAAAGTVDRLADRARLTPDQVEQRLSRARENPQGQVLADLFDEPGRVTTRAIAQSPGRTGQRAQEVARERASEQPARILTALRRGLSVGETRQAATQRLNGEYNRVSANQYQPLWRNPLPAANRQALEGRLQPYADDPVFRRAVQDAEAIFARDRRNGLVQGSINDNFARYAHYLKLGLDDASRLAANPTTGGIGPTQLRGVREMRARIIAAIDDNVPGYAEARARWGGIINAEEALDEGAGFLNMRPEEVRARLAQMTPFEQLHARIGLVDEVTRGMRGGRVVGQRNVANALDYRDTQDVIAAAFDNPQQAADFLDTLNTSNQLMRNSSTWLGGSPTYANAAHGADEALNVAGDMVGNVATGNLAGAARRGVQGGLNAITLGATEQANNQRGAALLTRVDTADAEEFGRQVVEELRRRGRARAAASATSRVGGAAAGQRQGRQD